MRSVWLILCFVLGGVTPSLSQSLTRDIYKEDTIGVDTSTKGVAVPRIPYTAQQFYGPGAMIGSGILLDLSAGVKNTQLKFHKEHLPHFHTPVDNYLLYVPAVVPYGLDAIGIPSKTDVVNRTAILLKAELLVAATGFALKHTIHEWRPDRSNHYSFPSGHALQVFATATMLSEEYGNRYKWMPFAAYGLASGVGVLRVANNKHYIGDVLVGAGLGILSMKVAYWTHRYKWHKRGLRK